MFRKQMLILAVIAFGAIYSSANTVTTTGSTTGSNSTTSYWNQTTYGTSSTVSNASMTGGQTSSSSPFSMLLSYSPLPSDASITAATLTFNVTGTETQSQSFISGSGPVTPGYYYTYYVSYSYSCGWNTCYGYYPVTNYYTYGYTSGTMSTSGYETGFLTQIQSGAMTQGVAPTSSGTIDLLALGLGSSLLGNSQLALGGSTSQSQSNFFTSSGWNDSTNFVNTTGGTADITATLNIDYQENPPKSGSSVPEPASLALVFSGLGAVVMKIRRRVQ